MPMSRYIILLYGLAVQADFYSDVVECSTFDQKFSRFDPRPKNGDFLRVRDKWRSM